MTDRDIMQQMLELNNALQARLAQPKQEPVAWPCEIEEADFEQDTITLKMLTSEYVVRAGKHWLSTTPPAAQPAPVPAAMKTVIEAMQADPDYAWSWHCNVAMAFVDAGGDHYLGNQGAARFMKMLANVEPAHDLPSTQPEQEPVAFEKWWEAEGQFCRAGGGEYEKTFAFRAWDAALANPPAAQRQWVGLTPEEIQNCYGGEIDDFARALLAKSKERNT
jgi:hypothetical protein